MQMLWLTGARVSGICNIPCFMCTSLLPEAPGQCSAGNVAGIGYCHLQQVSLGLVAEARSQTTSIAKYVYAQLAWQRQPLALELNVS